MSFRSGSPPRRSPSPRYSPRHYRGRSPSPRRRSPSPRYRRYSRSPSPRHYRRRSPPRHYRRRSPRVYINERDKRTSTTLFVGNLPYHFRENDVAEYFERCGRIANITIGVDKFTKQSRGYAFVAFSDRRDAEEAYDRFNGYNLEGRKLRIDWDAGLEKKQEFYGPRRSPRRGASRSPRRASKSPSPGANRSPRPRSRSPKGSPLREKRSRSPEKIASPEKKQKTEE